MDRLPADASEDHRKLVALLLELDQSHLLAAWPPGDASKADKHRFLDQVAGLERTLPGGLRAYHTAARELLEASRKGLTPFEGYVAEVPEGETLRFDDDERFETFEAAGLQEFRHTAVVLVAGGLGERLGYAGIKLELPVDLVTGMSYLEYYCRWIQAIERRLELPAGTIPFVIMTSGDTHAKTLTLLQDNHYFGLPDGQLALVRQETVPALADNDAHFALSETDAFQIQKKPQGHGVVHTLLHQHGHTARWQAEGKRWVAFLQDTNAPNFRCLLPTLGVSAARNLAANSVATAYRPGEAYGAICRLVHPDKRTLTLNVEYNQIGPLLAASGTTDTPDADGFSRFPGNINLLVYAVGPYADALRVSGGQVPNFVNPKYADATKTAFKKPTRLECMMQDFPRLLPEDALVGFTCYDYRHLSVAPCKNSITEGLAKVAAGQSADSAATAEHSGFALQARCLQRVGVTVETFPEAPVFAGIPVERYPHIALLPGFAVARGQMRTRFAAGNCRVSAASTLVLDGDITFEHLDLDGTLVITAAPGAKVTVHRMGVRNDGWPYFPLTNADAPEVLKIRGYDVRRRGQRLLQFTEPGDHIVDEPI